MARILEDIINNELIYEIFNYEEKNFGSKFTKLSTDCGIFDKKNILTLEIGEKITTAFYGPSYHGDNNLKLIPNVINLKINVNNSNYDFWKDIYELTNLKLLVLEGQSKNTDYLFSLPSSLETIILHNYTKINNYSNLPINLKQIIIITIEEEHHNNNGYKNIKKPFDCKLYVLIKKPSSNFTYYNYYDLLKYEILIEID